MSDDKPIVKMIEGKASKVARAQKRKPGRPPEALNVYTKEVKEMVLEALHNLGGVEWLQSKADERPEVFMALLGKVMQHQITINNNGGNSQINVYMSDDDRDL